MRNGRYWTAGFESKKLYCAFIFLRDFIGLCDFYFLDPPLDPERERNEFRDGKTIRIRVNDRCEPIRPIVSTVERLDLQRNPGDFRSRNENWMSGNAASPLSRTQANAFAAHNHRCDWTMIVIVGRSELRAEWVEKETAHRRKWTCVHWSVVCSGKCFALNKTRTSQTKE